jgi:ribosome silencing factor RsfS/YbeB/iojap
MTTPHRSPPPRRLHSARGTAPGRHPPQPKSKSAPYSLPATRPAKVPRGSELVALEKLVVASGTSDRHVRAIAESVIVQAKAAGRRPMGTEGEPDGEWVLVDLQDVLVHVMLPRVREFYALEQLWEAPQAQRRRSAAAPRGR